MTAAEAHALRSTEIGPWPTETRQSRRDCHRGVASADRRWEGELGERRTEHCWTCPRRTTYSTSDLTQEEMHAHLHTESLIPLDM